MILLCGAQSACDGAEPSASDAANLARLRKRIEAFVDKLRKIDDAVAAARDTDEHPCSKEDIERAYGSSAAGVPLIDRAYLRRYLRRGPDPYAGPNEGFSFLTSQSIRDLPEPSPVPDVARANTILFAIVKLQKTTPFVVILSTAKRAAPRLEGPKFHAGELSGKLFVVRLQDEEPICHGNLEVESSDEVAGIEGTPREQLLWQDFALSARRSLEREVSALGPGLSLDLD
jgi:hypothetical protein